LTAAQVAKEISEQLEDGGDFFFCVCKRKASAWSVFSNWGSSWML